MEELSIEEKANRYDEAIKRIEDIKTGKCETTFMFSEGLFEHIFPEHVESKDEKIRKAIYNCVEWFGFDSSVFKDVSQEECLAWIYKQGEQKHAVDTKVIIPKFRVGDVIHLKDSCVEYTIKSISDDHYYGNGFSFNIVGCDRDYELVEHNSTGNAEPKFKVGDWIISNYNHAAYIESISETKYNLQCIDGSHEKMSIVYVDNYWHKWSIQDAKDGDVLADRVGIILFRKIGNTEYKDVIDYYCYANERRFGKQKGIEHWGDVRDCALLHPSTREQRDTLFTKMKEAGYEWDFNNKELKKIEQRPAVIIPKFRIGDEIKTANEESLIITKIDEKGYWSEDLFICDFDEECVWDLVEQKLAWSEEDEKALDSILNDIKQGAIPDNDDINWLKTFKERVQLQPQTK